MTGALCRSATFLLIKSQLLSRSCCVLTTVRLGTQVLLISKQPPARFLGRHWRGRLLGGGGGSLGGGHVVVEDLQHLLAVPAPALGVAAVRAQHQLAAVAGDQAQAQRGPQVVEPPTGHPLPLLGALLAVRRHVQNRVPESQAALCPLVVEHKDVRVMGLWTEKGESAWSAQS